MKPRHLTENEKTIIRQRHLGWEKAKPSLLALIFGVSTQKITSIIRSQS